MKLSVTIKPDPDDRGGRTQVVASMAGCRGFGYLGVPLGEAVAHPGLPDAVGVAVVSLGTMIDDIAADDEMPEAMTGWSCIWAQAAWKIARFRALTRVNRKEAERELALVTFANYYDLVELRQLWVDYYTTPPGQPGAFQPLTALTEDQLVAHMADTEGWELPDGLELTLEI